MSGRGGNLLGCYFSLLAWFSTEGVPGSKLKKKLGILQAM